MSIPVDIFRTNIDAARRRHRAAVAEEIAQAIESAAEQIDQAIETDPERYFEEQASHWAKVYAKIAREVGARDV